MLRWFFHILDPNTRRRLRRFGRIKRAKWSLFLLLAIFVVSLFSDFIANEKPFLVKANGSLYFPIFKFYPEGEFTGSSVKTRPRYKELEKLPLFAEKEENWMLWPPIRYGPEESLEARQVPLESSLEITFAPADQLAVVEVDAEMNIQRSRGAASFYGLDSEFDLRRKPLGSEPVVVPDLVRQAVAKRFENAEAAALSVTNEAGIEFILSESRPRSRAPKLVRISMERRSSVEEVQKSVLSDDLEWIEGVPSKFAALTEEGQESVLARAKEALVVPQESLFLVSSLGKIQVSFDKETVEFPFRPIQGHIFGLDNSGRDAGVRILYATRTALLFGLILVVFTYAIGIFLGAVQGYFGGKTDLLGQRLTEIWESMPFLLIMILLSSIYGRSFLLLGFVYGIFNWIGISYYMRAEFLRLRKQPFVEAARVMGIGRWKIMFRHILPNALVPVITFFPFALVGAIFVLTALDYLGFGLPPGTPSWGNLLDQGQVQPYAWWLILYPSIALFVVSLLGIFIGEGVRAAFDPKTDSKLQ